jgi:hypothetical protein
MGKVVGALFGGTPKVEIPQVQPQPETIQEQEDPKDEEALARLDAARRAEEEKKRRGRSSLRQDLSAPASASSAGVFIPS